MDTKICRGCGAEKPATVEFFYKKKTGRDGLTARCRKCMNAYERTRYQKELIERQAYYRARYRRRKEVNPERYQYRNKSPSRRLNTKRQAMAAIKIEHGCADCGYKGHPSALQFHHLDVVEKDFTISTCVSRKSWGVLLDELNKCIVLCANCHAIRHAQKNNGTAVML